MYETVDHVYTKLSMVIAFIRGNSPCLVYSDIANYLGIRFDPCTTFSYLQMYPLFINPVAGEVGCIIYSYICLYLLEQLNGSLNALTRFYCTMGL